MSTIATGGKSELARNARAKDRSAAATKGHARRAKALQDANRKAREKTKRAREDAAAHPSPADMESSITRMRREAIVQRAILNAAHDRQSGQPNTCWLLPLLVQIDLVTRRFVSMEPLDMVRKAIPGANKPSRSAVMRWLDEVRPHFEAASEAYTKRAIASAEMNVARGDIEGITILFTQLQAESVVPMLDPLTYCDLPVTQQHLTVRVNELLAQVYKNVIEGRLRQAQTSKVLTALKSIAEGKGGATAEEMQAAARRTYIEAVGLPIAGDAGTDAPKGAGGGAGGGAS